jgi:TRAP-type uncharacterized transport system fused permease subunit
VVILAFTQNFSWTMAIFISMLALVVGLVPVCHVKGHKLEGMDIERFKHALEEGTKGATGVALACATAGIIAGIATLTGLGLKIAMLVSTISGGWPFFLIPGATLFVALVITMIACLILGMGLPTTATYVVLVTMAAPALINMDLPYNGVLTGALALLPIHMFVLYYGVLADVTPPVALAAYAASGIAKSKQFQTGLEAFKISLNKLMVPFAFVYSPALLLLGIDWASPVSIGWAAFDIVTMFMGILCLHASVTGYWLTHMTRAEKIVLFVSALVLIFPNLPGAVFGITALIVIYILQKSRILAGPDGKMMDGLRKMFPN